LTGNLWWLINKDLVTEWRARRAWPAMLVLGAIVAVLVSLQLDTLADEKQRVVGGLLWLAIFFAGMIAVDRSFTAERENSCWEGLTAYPLSATTLFAAKFIVNVIALAVVQAVVIPLFVILSGVPLLAAPAAMCLVAALGNIGIAAVGTLVSAVAARIARDNLLVILVLPLVVPVLVTAAEATRLLAALDFGPPWRHAIQLLAAFDVIFVTAGIMLFEFVMED
jgi:heme exporter protein B